MSLKGSWVVDHRRMIVTLHTDRLRTLQHVREFLEGNQEVDLVVATRAAAYGFIEQTLGRFVSTKGRLRRVCSDVFWPR